MNEKDDNMTCPRLDRQDFLSTDSVIVTCLELQQGRLCFLRMLMNRLQCVTTRKYIFGYQSKGNPDAGRVQLPSTVPAVPLRQSRTRGAKGRRRALFSARQASRLRQLSLGCGALNFWTLG